MTHRRIIGLTGNIGMGKSTVSDYLATAHHLPVIDADLLAREAVEVGSPILTRIVEHYGDRLLLSSGQLNRSALGEIIFNSPDERRWLEQQIHPYVRGRLQNAIDDSTAPTIVLAIPLLFEANMTDLVTEIWVVTCTPEQQLERICRRSQQSNQSLTLEQAKARVASQMPIETKIQKANVVLDNSGSKADLLGQVDNALNNSLPSMSFRL